MPSNRSSTYSETNKHFGIINEHMNYLREQGYKGSFRDYADAKAFVYKDEMLKYLSSMAHSIDYLNKLDNYDLVALYLEAD